MCAGCLGLMMACDPLTYSKRDSSLSATCQVIRSGEKTEIKTKALTIKQQLLWECLSIMMLAPSITLV